MPGRTPHEAVREFIEPIQQALSCVARAKISISPNGYDRVGVRHNWSINRDQGAPLSGGLLLRANMLYRIVKVDREGEEPYKVSTEGYLYHLEQRGAECYGFHWHPHGASPEKTPHLHLGPALLSQTAPITPSTHLSTGRTAFEQHVRWAIELGAKPLSERWADQLTLSESVFRLYRSWHGQDDAPALEAR